MAQEISTTEFKAKSQSREQSAFTPKFNELLTAWEQKFKGTAMVCDAEDQKELSSILKVNQEESTAHAHDQYR